MKTDVRSEIGKLEAVIIHTPGREVEDMTPQNAQRALYSDILNLSVASKEYSQFKRILKKVTKTFEVKDLLNKVLQNPNAKMNLINKLCINEDTLNLSEYLASLNSVELSRQLIEGVPHIKDNLTKYLSNEKFALRPLHNFFFTRDAAISIRDKVIVAKMASLVRERETIIMESIFENIKDFEAETINPKNYDGMNRSITIEGGDILVARDDVIIIGTGCRTTSHGIDFIIDRIKEKGYKRHIIVQELPHKPESFIHLDMVFTFLDKNECMVYSPIIMKHHSFQTIHIVIDNGNVKSIFEERNLISALNNLGFEIEPVICGGTNDERIQEREQWHSGANFFALAPGKVIGYGRNIYTIDEMNRHGFNIISAKDILKNKITLDNYNKYVITIEGTELARGGGGCRCMTMPFRRAPVDW